MSRAKCSDCGKNITIVNGGRLWKHHAMVPRRVKWWHIRRQLVLVLCQGVPQFVNLAATKESTAWPVIWSVKESPKNNGPFPFTGGGGLPIEGRGGGDKASKTDAG